MSDGPVSAAAGTTTHHEDGTATVVAVTSPSTPINHGVTLLPPANAKVPNQPIGLPSTTTLWLTGKTGGSANLGEIYRVALDSNTATVQKTFTGRPWMQELKPTSVGMVFNPMDKRFYGVMTDIGVQYISKIIAFDPATDKFEVVKTLSSLPSGQTAGIGTDTLADGARGGYYRKPLLSPNGKAMLLMAERGGRDDRGLLVHVNLDTGSTDYLRETVVYDFFEYELSRGDYCRSLIGTPTELAWGKDGSGNAVVYMGRNGANFSISSLEPKTTDPATCHVGPLQAGIQTYRKYGRVFALKPSASDDLSKPWTFVALGNDANNSPLGSGVVSDYRFDPLLHLGRNLFYDTGYNKVRWTTETPGGGPLGLFLGNQDANPTFWAANGPNRTYCYRLGGFLPQIGGGDAILTCSGLNGGGVGFEGLADQAPLVFSFTGAGGGGESLSLKNQFADWFSAAKIFAGTSYSGISRLMFASSSNLSETCIASNVNGVCAGTEVSTLEELNPAESFYRRLRATGDVLTTGGGFVGDPAVGGAAGEPIPDRYIVWMGTTVANASMAINKHDRLTGKTTTVKIDTDAGAYPWGKLLDLGNGLAMGRIEQTPPKIDSTKNPDKIGGYRGQHGYANSGSRPGIFTVNVKTGEVLRFAAQSGEAFSRELARTDDGSVWGSRWLYGGITASGDRYVHELRKIDPATGSSTLVIASTKPLARDMERQTSPTARGSAVYHLGASGAVYWANSPAVLDYTVTCVRADDLAVRSVSGLIGPVDQSGAGAGMVSASGGAHQPLEAATWSPTHDALYLITTMQEKGEGISFLEIDKGVAPANLCRQPVILNRLTVTGVSLADMPTTRLLATKSGLLVYGTRNGRLMKFDPLAGGVTLLADLAAPGLAASSVRGFLTEVADGVISAVVYDFDANGNNVSRRIAGVSTSGAKVGGHD
ncbi:MAG: Chitinase precursor, partial [Pseudomonadota bacterium]